MSWFKDPQWYLENDNGTMKIYRVRENFSSPIAHGDFTDVKVISNYLSLVDHSFSWRRSDFDAFAAFLDKYDIIVNCQGVVLTLTFPRDRALNKPIISRSTRLWSHDVVDLRRYGLHVPTVPFRVVRYLEGGPAPVESSPKENELAAKLAACIKERDQEKSQNIKERDQEKSQKQALEKRVSELKEELLKEKKTVSDLKVTNAALEDELVKEKNNKQDLERQNSELTSKLEECRNCLSDKDAWMRECKVPSDWVSFEDLDVYKLPRNTPSLTISKVVSGVPRFNEDGSTNVQVRRFYRGVLDGGMVYPIVVVNIQELVPDQENARFDAEIWGSFNNAGVCYAARKAYESEMS